MTSILSNLQIEAIDREMSINDYSLWFVCTALKKLIRLPVYTYEQANEIAFVLDTSLVSGVRIARYDPCEGCESVLHKFY